MGMGMTNGPRVKWHPLWTSLCGGDTLPLEEERIISGFSGEVAMAVTQPECPLRE